MTEHDWLSLTPDQQAAAWWAELTLKLQSASARIQISAGNDTTRVLPGLTTIVERIRHDLGTLSETPLGR